MVQLSSFDVVLIVLFYMSITERKGGYQGGAPTSQKKEKNNANNFRNC